MRARCTGPISGPAERERAEGWECRVLGGAASLGVHLLDKAEGGVGHEQGEDDPEVQDKSLSQLAHFCIEEATHLWEAAIKDNNCITRFPD